MHHILNVLIARLSTLWAQAFDIWLAGGWAMVGIAVLALVMFALGLHVHFQLRHKGFQKIREKTWRRWIDQPGERQGPVGDILDVAMSPISHATLTTIFKELRASEIAPFARDLHVMKICVRVAPLLGLLGTVAGMLTTFGALASGSGGDKTMGLVAEGISEALITTETGLVIALAGLFFHYQLVHKFERYKGFLAHLETGCSQAVYRRRQQTEKEASDGAFS